MLNLSVFLHIVIADRDLTGDSRHHAGALVDFLDPMDHLLSRQVDLLGNLGDDLDGPAIS